MVIGAFASGAEISSDSGTLETSHAAATNATVSKAISGHTSCARRRGGAALR
jgi:hypothetical protein